MSAEVLSENSKDPDDAAASVMDTRRQAPIFSALGKDPGLTESLSERNGLSLSGVSAERSEEFYYQSSLNAASRPFLMLGKRMSSRRKIAIISKTREMGRVKKVEASPRERSIALLRFSSIIGPRIKPRINGAVHISVLQINTQVRRR